MPGVFISYARSNEQAAELVARLLLDSGYEVWVYRWKGADGTTRGATELVLLFEPSGLATKLRLRPGYPAQR